MNKRSLNGFTSWYLDLKKVTKDSDLDTRAAYYLELRRLGIPKETILTQAEWLLKDN